MTRYRFRGIFLLFLMGHATACAHRLWEPIDVGVSPWVDYIESQQPDQVRITTAGGRAQWVLSFPLVEGDEIVDGDGDLSVPIPEIIKIEESVINPITTVAKTTGAAYLLALGIVAIGELYKAIESDCWSSSC